MNLTIDIVGLCAILIFGYGTFRVSQYRQQATDERLREHTKTTDKQSEVLAAHSTAIATIAEAIVSLKKAMEDLADRIQRNESRVERHQDWHDRHTDK